MPVMQKESTPLLENHSSGYILGRQFHGELSTE